MLLVPSVEFHRVAVLADRHHAQQPQVGVLLEPVREPVGQLEGQVPVLGCRPTGDDPDPAAQVVDADIEVA